MTPPAPLKDTAGVIAPPPLLYAIPLLLGLLANHWWPTPFLPEPVSRTAGLGLVSCALFGLPAILAFRRARTSPKPWEPTSALVTTGPYRLSRNPMYVGFSALYLGVTVLYNALWPLLAFPIVAAVMHVGVIRREERYLTRLFGEAYIAYCRTVRRYL